MVPNPTLFYSGAKHRMAMTYLEYGLSESTGFILLTGEVGIGKTTLIRRLLANTESSTETAVLSNTQLSADDLIKQVMREFDLSPDPNDKSANLSILSDFLIDRYSQGERSLLIIDEAQNLSFPALEEIRMLSNLQTHDANLLQIILVGQPELRWKIRDPRLAQLAQRIAVSYHIAPMDKQETIEYIRYRLRRAGREDDRLFTPEAQDMIFESSKGIPRSINILCEMALVYAFGNDFKVVDSSIVEQVVADRGHDSAVNQEVVWDDLQESNDSSLLTMTDKDVTRRLKRLESIVNELASVVRQHGRELQDRLSEDKDRLVLSLQSLLEKERTKSDKLMVESQYYSQKVKQLEKHLSETHQFVQPMNSLEKFNNLQFQKNTSNKPRPNFFNRLFKLKK